MTTLESPLIVDQPRAAEPPGRKKLGLLAAALARPAMHQGAFSLFDQAVVSATNFFTAWAIARTCSRAELGIYYLAFAIVLFVRGIQEQVISTPYTVYCNRRRGDSLASYTGSTLLHQFTLASLAVAGLLGLAGLLSWGVGPADLTATVWVLLVALPAYLLRDYLRFVAFAQLRPAAALAMDLVVAVIQVGGILALVGHHAVSSAAVYVVVGAACAAGCIGWLVARRQPVRIVPAQAVRDWRQNWSFIRWTLASQLLGSCAPQVLPWILGTIHGSDATGFLGACSTLIGLSYMFVTGVGNFLTPKAARAFALGGVEGLRTVLRPAALLFVAVLGSFCAAVAAIGDRLPVVVYGQQYAGAGSVTTLLALAILVGSLSVVAGSGLLAMERPSATFRADAYSVVVMLAAAACLVPTLGAVGAAMASLAGVSIGAAVRMAALLGMMRKAKVIPATPMEARA